MEKGRLVKRLFAKERERMELELDSIALGGTNVSWL